MFMITIGVIIIFLLSFVAAERPAQLGHELTKGAILLGGSRCTVGAVSRPSFDICIWADYERVIRSRGSSR